MTNTDDLGPALQIESVSPERFKKNVQSRFKKDPYSRRPGSLVSKLREYPSMKFYKLTRVSADRPGTSVELPGTWGVTDAVLIEETEITGSSKGKMLDCYEPLKAAKKGISAGAKIDRITPRERREAAG